MTFDVPAVRVFISRVNTCSVLHLNEQHHETLFKVHKYWNSPILKLQRRISLSLMLIYC